MKKQMSKLNLGVLDERILKEIAEEEAQRQENHEREHEVVAMPELKSLLENFSPEPYDVWLQVGMALHHYQRETGQPMLPVWKQWASQSQKYKEEEHDKKWTSFGKYGGRPLTLGTLFHKAKNNNTPLAKLKKISQEERSDFYTLILNAVDVQRNIEILHETNPFYFDDLHIFWIWDAQKCVYHDCDETTLMNKLHEKFNISGTTLPRGIHYQYVEALKRVGRKNKPENLGKDWIQFADTLVNYKTMEMKQASPDLFCVVRIPWKLGDSEHTPTIDGLFRQWQPKKFMTLHEWNALLIKPGTNPFQELLFKYGSGANGKSCYSSFQTKLVGKENVMATDLDLLMKNRFEAGYLHNKKLVEITEVNYAALKKTDVLKRLTGEDLLRGEIKYAKKVFQFYNEAIISISGNGIPRSDDNSIGFIRRWHILKWNQKFNTGPDPVRSIPDWEFSNYCFKLLRILRELLERGRFTHHLSNEQKRKLYDEISNPFPKFLAQCCNRTDHKEDYTLYVEVKQAYNRWLKINNYRTVRSKAEFDAILNEELFDFYRAERPGYTARMYVFGLVLKPFEAWVVSK